MEDRQVGFLLSFLSTIFLSLFLPASALPQISSESAFSLRYFANLCASALNQACAIPGFPPLPEP